MPFTPYHFGPSGFIGLVFRKWIDLPVFLLANVIVDVEVLIWSGWPVHRYAHTLLIGAAVGIVWGIAAYPLSRFFKRIMELIRLPYETGFWKMVISGVLGVWLHVVLDAIYHWDVRIFWPNNARPLYGLVSRSNEMTICNAFFAAAVIVYASTVLWHMKRDKAAK